MTKRKMFFKDIWREIGISFPSVALLQSRTQQRLPTPPPPPHNSYKVITVPSVQTVTSWSSTECPTACSPPVPVTSARKWNKWHWTYRKKNTETFPYGKRGWAVKAKKRLTSFLCFSKSLIFFSYTSTSQGLAGVFSAAFPLWGGGKNIPKSKTFLH